MILKIFKNFDIKMISTENNNKWLNCKENYVNHTFEVNFNLFYKINNFFISSRMIKSLYLKEGIYYLYLIFMHQK